MENMNDAIGIFDYLGKTDILLAFCGKFDHHLNTSILKNSQIELNELGAAFGISKKVYNVLVECIENVTRYASHDSLLNNKSMLLLCKSNNSYKIITCNPIIAKDADTLKQRLETIKKQNLNDLKAIYREQILSEKLLENAAGLGILDIAIKTENKFDYHFKPYSQNTSLYFFQAEISI